MRSAGWLERGSGGPLLAVKFWPRLPSEGSRALAGVFCWRLRQRPCGACVGHPAGAERRARIAPASSFGRWELGAREQFFGASAPEPSSAGWRRCRSSGRRRGGGWQTRSRQASGGCGGPLGQLWDGGGRQKRGGDGDTAPGPRMGRPRWGAAGARGKLQAVAAGCASIRFPNFHDI